MLAVASQLATSCKQQEISSHKVLYPCTSDQQLSQPVSSCTAQSVPATSTPSGLKPIDNGHIPEPCSREANSPGNRSSHTRMPKLQRQAEFAHTQPLSFSSDSETPEEDRESLSEHVSVQSDKQYKDKAVREFNGSKKIARQLRGSIESASNHSQRKLPSPRSRRNSQSPLIEHRTTTQTASSGKSPTIPVRRNKASDLRLRKSTRRNRAQATHRLTKSNSDPVDTKGASSRPKLVQTRRGDSERHPVYQRIITGSMFPTQPVSQQLLSTICILHEEDYRYYQLRISCQNTVVMEPDLFYPTGRDRETIKGEIEILLKAVLVNIENVELVDVEVIGVYFN